jgi:hypothetical protein
VRTAGSRLRATAQLNEAQTGYQVWSRRYDRSMDDVFATQDEIAADIVAALAPEMGAAAAPQIVRYTENAEASRLYLRGRHQWYARSQTALQKAQQYYEEAIEKDPEYALPYVGLADLHAVQALYYVPPKSGFCRAPRASGSRRRSTTASVCRSVFSPSELRTTESDSIEPP